MTSFSRYGFLLKVKTPSARKGRGTACSRGDSDILTTPPCVYGRAGRQELPDLSRHSFSNCSEKWEQRENKGILRSHYLYTMEARKRIKLPLENARLLRSRGAGWRDGSADKAQDHNQKYNKKRSCQVSRMVEGILHRLGRGRGSQSISQQKLKTLSVCVVCCV